MITKQDPMAKPLQTDPLTNGYSQITENTNPNL